MTNDKSCLLQQRLTCDLCTYWQCSSTSIFWKRKLSRCFFFFLQTAIADDWRAVIACERMCNFYQEVCAVKLNALDEWFSVWFIVITVTATSNEFVSWTKEICQMNFSEISKKVVIVASAWFFPWSHKLFLLLCLFL